MKTLILGGARSGKSALAEQLAARSQLPVTCIVTARALDPAMEARIAAHRRRRPAGWQLVEAPLQLAAALRDTAQPERCLLVDCLAVWLSNLLVEREQAPDDEIEALHALLPSLPGELLLVSAEAGLGVVPAGALSRAFVDHCGLLHQRLAAGCDRVLLSVAGLPQTLKGALNESPEQPIMRDLANV